MVGGLCGCPHHTGSLKKLGKCHDMCREVCPSLGFGVTEPDTVIELIFQNFGLQLKKKVSSSQYRHLPRSIWYCYGNRMQAARAWPHKQWLMLMDFRFPSCECPPWASSMLSFCRRQRWMEGAREVRLWAEWKHTHPRLQLGQDGVTSS